MSLPFVSDSSLLLVYLLISSSLDLRGNHAVNLTLTISNDIRPVREMLGSILFRTHAL